MVDMRQCVICSQYFFMALETSPDTVACEQCHKDVMQFNTGYSEGYADACNDIPPVVSTDEAIKTDKRPYVVGYASGYEAYGIAKERFLAIVQHVSKRRSLEADALLRRN